MVEKGHDVYVLSREDLFICFLNKNKKGFCGCTVTHWYQNAGRQSGLQQNDDGKKLLHVSPFIPKIK